MPGTLYHSPADIVRQALIDMGLGTLPSEEGAWPVFVSVEPDRPDNCMTVTDTLGKDNGRIMVDGVRPEHHGFQIRFRATSHPVGYLKARAVAVALDSLYQRAVTVTTSGTDRTYLIHCVNRAGDVLYLGQDVSDRNKRDLFTINGTSPILLDS